MASKDLYAIPGSEVPDFDVKGDISPTADMESQEKINHVEANMMPAQRRSNFYSMLAGGAGLLADGYQNSLASPPDLQTGNVIFKRIFGASVYTPKYQAQIANALLVGTILGQFSMGFVVDRVGRKAAMTITTLFIVLGGILGTVAHAPSAVGFFWFITVARGMVGYGAGGEYPAASTASIEGAEASFKKHRGFFFMMTTTGCLITGQLLTLIVCLIILGATKYDNSRIPSELKKLEITWRVEWAVGVVLPLAVLYFRMKLMNSTLYQASALKQNVPYWLFIKRYWRRLIGTFGTWFTLQFIGYPAGVFSGVIIGSAAPGATMTITIAWLLLLATLSIPGTLLGAWATSHVNRKYQLCSGFLGYTVLGLLIGLAYTHVTRYTGVFVVLYGLYLTVGCWGPGNLNGLILVEAYPTSMRGTAYGWTAAIGKLGGVCGTQAFGPIAAKLGVRYTFIIGGSVGFIGALIGWFFIPDTRKINLAEEDEEWRQYLIANGWKGHFGVAEADVSASHMAVPQL